RCPGLSNSAPSGLGRRRTPRRGGATTPLSPGRRACAMKPIYLDYNATTPLDPAVVDAMLPYLKEGFGNPSSAHAYGKAAHDAVERARARVADLLGARPDDVVFTGGGTEASNQALKGVVFARMRGFFARWRGAPHLVISAFEHPATA